MLGDINRYVAHKQYNTDTGDLIFAMLCYTFSVLALIYTYHNNDVLEEQKPRQDDAITMMLKSAQNLHSHDTLSPECLRPFPRAPPRKTRSANNKRRKYAILTDSPEKAAIEQHT